MSKKLVLVCLATVLVLSAIAYVTSLSFAEKQSVKEYVTREPIHINGDEQFTSANGVSSGAGTETSPYIIENWNISGGGAHGIWIENTRAYFVIKDCQIHSTTGYERYGIYFYNVTNGTITNCNISGNSYRGISFYKSSYDNISSCVVSSNGIGVYLDSSSYCDVLSNNVSQNGNGIEVCYSDNTTITGNNVCLNLARYWGYGIYLDNSKSSTISGNTITSNKFGIWLSCSRGNILENNILQSNTRNFNIFGEYASDFEQSIASSNTVNGKPIYYWVSASGATIPSDAGFVGLVYCKNIVVSGLTLTNNSYGIMLISSNNSTIEDNWVYSNPGVNTGYFGGTGIYLRFGANDNIIRYNNASSNGFGIAVLGCVGNKIYDNKATLNFDGYDGGWIGSFGIYLKYGAHYNEIYNNNISENNRGLTLDHGCDGNLIYKNKIYSNKGYGIHMEISQDNRVDNNSIIF